MDGQLITAALAGPLLMLGLFELFGVKRLISIDSLKVFFGGLVFAIVSLPLLVFVGAAVVEPGREVLFELGGRMVRIWLIIFGLAVLGRWSIAVCRWLWNKRPRATRYEPGRDGDASR